MDGVLHPHRPRLPHVRVPRVAGGFVVGLEVVLLAPLALVVVLGWIPNAFDVNWGCVATTQETRSAGDMYVATFAVLGALGWLVAAGATAIAAATEHRRLALVIPLAWFAALTLAAALAAWVIGPLPC